VIGNKVDGLGYMNRVKGRARGEGAKGYDAGGKNKALLSLMKLDPLRSNYQLSGEKTLVIT